ncbi:MAG: Gfo/Idh/MocA family oxidoreductase [Flavobacteriales bacterium]
MPSNNRPLRVGVIGAGHLGRIHIQQWKEVPEAVLVGFHDPDGERSELITKEFGVPSLPMAALLEGCDALDIVTPTVTHASLAEHVLRAGRHLFIEKPLAERLEEADALIALARERGVKAQVGHVERFNPAFRAALPSLREPMFIESHRLAQFNPRGTDVSVVLDLMIHDIDLVLHVVNSEVVDVQASGVAVVSDTPDIANARIAFANGCVANLTASRISLKNMRKNRFFQRDAYISVDLLERSSEIVRMRTVEGEGDPFAVTIDLGSGKGRREISFEKPEIPPSNAIREELRAFTLSVLHDGATEVPLEDGRKAMEVAFRILECMRLQAAGTITY